MEIASKGDSANWSVAIRWKLMWLFLFKVGLLTLLWAFCFSPSHRNTVNSTTTSRQLGVGGATDPSPLDRLDPTEEAVHE
jgi:hypothetical protein